MSRTDNGKVATVECRDPCGAETLSHGDDGCIDESEAKVLVRGHEFRGPSIVGGVELLDPEGAIAESGEESRFVLGPKATIEHDARLGHHWRRDNQQRFREKQSCASIVVLLALIEGREEDARVDDEH